MITVVDEDVSDIITLALVLILLMQLLILLKLLLMLGLGLEGGFASVLSYSGKRVGDRCGALYTRTNSKHKANQ